MEETKSKLSKKSLLGLLILVLPLIFLLEFQIPIKKGLAGDVDSITRTCRSENNKESCYAKAFETLTKSTDRDYAFAVLRELQRKDAQARGCHFIAHAISTAETEKDITKWKELLNTAPPDCSYGGVHGVLEAYAANAFPDGKLPKEIIPSLCDNPDMNNCVHGLGHLILVETEDDIKEALDICDLLPHNTITKFECITGVFMERITAVNLEIHGLAGKETLDWPARMPELETLCKEQIPGTPPSIACWKEITHAALAKFNNDPQKIVVFCESAPGETETRQCIDHSLGIMAGSLNFELRKMGPICNAEVEADDYKNRCYAHLISSTMSTVPEEIASAVQFCASAEEEFQSSCFSMIGNSFNRVRPESRETLARECSQAPQNMREKCEQGGYTGIVFYSGD